MKFLLPCISLHQLLFNLSQNHMKLQDLTYKSSNGNHSNGNPKTSSQEHQNTKTTKNIIKDVMYICGAAVCFILAPPNLDNMHLNWCKWLHKNINHQPTHVWEWNSPKRGYRWQHRKCRRFLCRSKKRFFMRNMRTNFTAVLDINGNITYYS